MLLNRLCVNNMFSYDQAHLNNDIYKCSCYFKMGHIITFKRSMHEMKPIPV